MYRFCPFLKPNAIWKVLKLQTFYGSVIAQIILRRYPDLIWWNEIHIIICCTFRYVYYFTNLLFR